MKCSFVSFSDQHSSIKRDLYELEPSDQYGKVKFLSKRDVLALFGLDVLFSG